MLSDEQLSELSKLIATGQAKLLRLSAGLTYTGLAKEWICSPASLSLIERGRLLTIDPHTVECYYRLVIELRSRLGEVVLAEAEAYERPQYRANSEKAGRVVRQLDRLRASSGGS